MAIETFENLPIVDTGGRSLISALDAKKISFPNDGADFGNSGDQLRSLGNGGVEWAAPGMPTYEQTEQAISDWLDEHPEATTTVADGAITDAKLNDALKRGLVYGFATVADMKAADTLKAGMICRTNGFHSSGDGGAAWYKITDTGTANEMDVIECGELFANLVINDYVTPEMFGAYGNGVTDDNAYLKAAFNSGFPVILSKTYSNQKILGTFNDLVLIGNGVGRLSNDDQESVSEFIITFSGKPYISGINFIQNVGSEKGWQAGNIGFIGTDGAIVENCSFECLNHKANGTIDIYANNKNFLMNNCTLNTDMTYNGVVEHGGGIWVRQVGAGISENITISNCVFKALSADEVMTPWCATGTELKNVLVDNCILESLPGSENVYIESTYNAQGVCFNNCSFIRNNNNCPTNSAFISEKGTKWETDNRYIAKYNNCNFINDNSSNVKYFAYPTTESSIVSNSTIYMTVGGLSGAIFKDCDIYIDEYNYGGAFTIENSKIVINQANIAFMQYGGTCKSSDIKINNIVSGVVICQQGFFVFENCTVETPGRFSYLINNTDRGIKLIGCLINSTGATIGAGLNTDSIVANNVWKTTNIAPDSSVKQNNNYFMS